MKLTCKLIIEFRIAFLAMKVLIAIPRILCCCLAQPKDKSLGHASIVKIS